MLLDRGALDAGGLGLSPDRSGRRARGSRDAARADRGASRRPAGGRAPRGPGRGGARQDLHEAGARRPDGNRRHRARAAALLADPQGGARRPGRPALARARPVRVPAGPAAEGRLRDAREGGPKGAPPRGRRSARAGLGRAGGRGGRRFALPRRLRGGARRRRRAGNPIEGGRPARARRRACGVARRERRGAALLRPGGGAGGRRRDEGGACTSRQAEWPGAARGPPRRGRCSRTQARSSRRKGLYSVQRASRRSLADLDYRDGHPPAAVARLEATLEALEGSQSRRGRRRGGRAARSLSRPQPPVRARCTTSRSRPRAGRGAAPAGGVRPGVDEQVGLLHVPQPPGRKPHPARGSARARPRR